MCIYIYINHNDIDQKDAKMQTIKKLLKYKILY